MASTRALSPRARIALLAGLLGMACLGLAHAQEGAIGTPCCASRPETIVTHLQTFLSRNGLDACHQRAKQMVDNTFAFFRASLPLYYRDMAADRTISDSPWSNNYTVTTIQGDAHMSNMGSFSNAKGDVVYDLNDFDEGYVGSYLLDVNRMAISMVLVARDNGLDTPQARQMVKAFVANYTDRMWDFWNNDKEMDATWGVANAYGPLKTFLQKQIDSRGTAALLKKWTDKPGSKKKGTERRVFETSAKNPDLEAATWEEVQAIKAAWPGYIASVQAMRNETVDPSYFTILDVARRVNAGLTSIGIPRFYVLCRGPSDSIDDDAILDVKLQRAPTAAPLTNQTRVPSGWEEEAFGAQRVPRVQSIMLAHPDRNLGFFTIPTLGRFSVRQLNPHRESYALTGLPPAARLGLPVLEDLAAQYGKILAANHARGDKDARALNNLTNELDFAFFQLVIDDDFGPRRIDPFIRSVVALAVQYADKYEADRALFKAAYQAGNICKPASDVAGRRFRRSMRSVTRALRMAEHPMH